MWVRKLGSSCQWCARGTGLPQWKVGVGDRLPIRVADDERLLKLADGPGCKEAAGRHRSHTLVIAGLSGFLLLSQSSERPER